MRKRIIPFDRIGALLGRLILPTALLVAVSFFLVSPAFAKTVGITVTIYPEEVRDYARFIIQGQEYRSGSTASVESSTNYPISFTQVPGWKAPKDDVITVKNRDISWPGDDRSKSTYEQLEEVPGIVIHGKSKWPLWPRTSSNANVWEPYSFTSIGRDVVSWVTFEPMLNNPFFWLSMNRWGKSLPRNRSTKSP